MFRLADGALLGRWQAHLGARALAVTFAGGYVFTGGSDGSVARRRVDGADDDCEQLHPKHDGAVRSFAHRTGILCSAAVDGTVRVWDLRPNEDAPPNVLYGFSGYKVWIGSVECDDMRLLSDGSDNAVIMHSFARQNEATRDGARGA